MAIGVGILALMVYVATIAPSLSFAHYGTDGGNLIAAARTLGIPHPPGYPTYTLLAWLFIQLPIGDIAYRVNLMSAVFASCVVSLLCLSVYHLLPSTRYSLAIAASTALALAFSPLFWSQALISEVYTLLMFFCALLLWLIVQWRYKGGDGYLWAAAFFLGLGLGNHLTLVFVLPAAVILFWEQYKSKQKSWLRVRSLLPALGLFFIGLSVYIYLPIAATQNPPINWGNPQTLERFLWVVTGRQYHSLVFGLPREVIPGRLLFWARLLGRQFYWWGLIIIPIGIWRWWKRDRVFFLFTIYWMLLVSLYSFFYYTGDSHIYLLPVVLLLAIWWGQGIHYMVNMAGRLGMIWQNLVLVIILMLPFVSLARHWRAIDLSNDWVVPAYIEQVLGDVESGGFIISQGYFPTFSLWYALYAEEKRPDVIMVSGQLLSEVWYRDNLRRLFPDLILNEPVTEKVDSTLLIRDLVFQNYTQGPIYTTDPREAWEVWFDFIRVGEAPLYQFQLKTDGQEGE